MKYSNQVYIFDKGKRLTVEDLGVEKNPDLSNLFIENCFEVPPHYVRNGLRIIKS
jgi:hypothetical protein